MPQFEFDFKKRFIVKAFPFLAAEVCPLGGEHVKISLDGILQGVELGLGIGVALGQFLEIAVRSSPYAFTTVKQIPAF